MDSRIGISSDQTRHPSRPVCAPNRNRGRNGTKVAVAQTRCSTKGGAGSETPRLDEAQDPQQYGPWADLPPDILGDVAARFALVEDRARLRCVCRAWRAAARVRRGLPPPLPLLVLSDFSAYGFRSGGTMTSACRRVPLPERDTPASGSVRCVGSFEGWLVGVKSNQSRCFGDFRCFLMNALSGAVIHLPPPSSAAASGFVETFSTSLPIFNASGVVNCVINATPCVMSFTRVILSSSPDSGSNCVVAAISIIKSATKLALWRSGMKSWCVCKSVWIRVFHDVAFCQGKLFMLCNSSEFTTDLLAFEIADDNNGLMVSHVVRCAIEIPQVSYYCFSWMWNIVEWRGKLLIVQTCLGDDRLRESFAEVRVYVPDMSANPVRFTEIDGLEGDCIFISPCSCNSFRSRHYGGHEGDHIYVIFGQRYRFAYNMKDGRVAPFAAGIPEDKVQAADGTLTLLSTWLFPAE